MYFCQIDDEIDDTSYKENCAHNSFVFEKGEIRLPLNDLQIDQIVVNWHGSIFQLVRDGITWLHYDVAISVKADTRIELDDDHSIKQSVIILLK